ncbi:MAG: sulfite exporter TauE/SafE family protein [Acidimicrobiales bacterium]
MSAANTILLFVGGALAGMINAMAGGGSLLTVPLLSLVGVEGVLANATNRVAVLVQNGSAIYGFRKRGKGAGKEIVPVLVPVLVGGLVGSYAISGIDDETFERLFGVLMIPLLVLALWKPRVGGSAAAGSAAGGDGDAAPEPWPTWVNWIVFFAVGLYMGSIQAGVGLILLLVLSRAGHDLVTGNAIKVWAILSVSIVAVAVFVAKGQVAWWPAAVLSAGTAVGGYAGANLAVSGGERLIKPVLAVSVVALAGRMIGLY